MSNINKMFPMCKRGQHNKCSGVAWSQSHLEEGYCQCECHIEDMVNMILTLRKSVEEIGREKSLIVKKRREGMG